MNDNIKKWVEDCRSGKASYQTLLDKVPYASFLGMEVVSRGEEVYFLLPRKDTNVGNPTLPALHGGAVAGFMEQAALVFILLEMGEPRIPKTIDLTVDYLRAGLVRDTYAECSITRLGRRVANVHISAWQVRREDPIAIARAHFLLSEESS